MSDDILLYEGECFELGLEPLDEAGGLFSVLKRYFVGSDMGVVEEARREIARGFATAQEKRAMLGFLDNLIEEAEGTIEKGVRGHAISAAASTAGLAVAGGLIVGKVATAIKVGSFFTPGSGSATVSTALVDHALTLAGLALAAVGTAGMLVSLVSNLAKLIALKRGTVQEYLAVLRPLRAQVAAARVLAK